VSDDVIVADHLAKSYGSARGIADVSFRVRAGEVFGFLGPNGAGKTTTIRTLLGFLRPTGGRASIFGLDVTGDGLEIRRRSGYLPGDLELYERMTGGQLVEYLGALRGGVDADTVDRLVARLDLEPDRRIEDLSHGNRQKVGLVQALMHRPDLVVLDEPTQGLDPLVQQEFHRIVREISDEGRTVLVSSHVLSEVERICDRVGIIREGVVVAVESVGDLTARAIRHVQVRFSGTPPVEELRAIDGVQDVTAIDSTVRLVVSGPMDTMVKALARHDVVDLVSEKPSLEEVFLAFYGEADRAP
jgi:ABC-2 type transport system ATP-binding protein